MTRTWRFACDRTTGDSSRRHFEERQKLWFFHPPRLHQPPTPPDPVVTSHGHTARPSSTELPDPARPSSNELLTLRPSDPYADWDFDLDDEGLFHCCRGRLRRVRVVCPCVGGAWWPEEPKRCGGKREDRSTGCWTKATSGGTTCRRSAWPDMTRTVICQLGVVDRRSMDRHHL